MIASRIRMIGMIGAAVAIGALALSWHWRGVKIGSLRSSVATERAAHEITRNSVTALQAAIREQNDAIEAQRARASEAMAALEQARRSSSDAQATIDRLRASSRVQSSGSCPASDTVLEIWQ